MSEAVTIERLERGLALSAYLVMRHGPVEVPIFERRTGASDDAPDAGHRGKRKAVAGILQWPDHALRDRAACDKAACAIPLQPHPRPKAKHGRCPPGSGTSPLKVDMPSNKQQPGENGPPRARAEAVAKEIAVN
jgi:hypothetical protein